MHVNNLPKNARKHKAETSSPFFSQTDYIQGVMDGVKWAERKPKRNRTMSKAEKFIDDCTRNCSSDIIGWDNNGLPIYNPWLTPDQARKAVEIAREEIYEWLEENAVNFVALADNEHPAIGDTKAFYGTKSLIYWLKQAIEDE